MKDYHINIFYSEEDGGYIADVPDLNACSAFGNTPEEALAEVTIAKVAWLEVAQLAGKPIPEPHYRADMLDFPLRLFLIEESRRVAVAKELTELVKIRESELADENKLDKLFDKYLSEIPSSEQPKSRGQERKLYGQWEDNLRQELAEWRDSLEAIGFQSSDPKAVLERAREKLLRLFEVEARKAALLPEAPLVERR